MSIFKSTLKPFVAAQLKAREKVVGQVDNNNVAGIGLRDNTFLRYTTGKNGWVRMISMVNYNSQKFNKDKGKWTDDKRYVDNQLTKKYILEGGALFEGDKGFYLRRGVNKKDGVYGSNIDKINNDPKSNQIDRLFGIRPMPGITSVSIQNKSAYGSLREATVNFYAWDKHQLEELEVLFMRPGYSVFIDWGWSQYLDHGPAKQSINSYPDGPITIENLLAPVPIDLLNPIEEDKIYALIDTSIEKYNGNYDAMIGFVKNFSWQLMSNGGWQCTTTIISRGEALEEIKASNNPRTIIGSKSIPAPSSGLNTSEAEEPPISFFEKLFLTIKGALNNSETTDLGNPPPPTPPPVKEGETPPTPTPAPTPGPTGEFYAQGVDNTVILNKISEEFEFIKTALKEETTKYKVYNSKDDGSAAGVYDYYGQPINNFPGGVLPAEGSTDGSGIEYISFNMFVAILQRFFIPRSEKTIIDSNKKQKIFDSLLYLVLPGRTPCLMSEDTVSIDPTTCLVHNPYASFITNVTDGFTPKLYTNLTWNGKELTPGITIGLPTFPLDGVVKDKIVKVFDKDNKTTEVPQKIVSVGEIGNIYISIGKIIQTYRDLSGSNGVNITDLLTSLLESISFSLGGINDFKLYTDKNIIQIIDAKYLEVGESANNKFKMDVIGLKSVCRAVTINSKIFPEQASMIAIGAAASGDASSNLGDIYASTQALFNKGLKDRVIRDLTFSEGNKNSSPLISGENLFYFQIYENVRALTAYVKRKVLGIQEPVNTKQYNYISTPKEEEISNASNLLKTLLYQLNGKDIDFKALIPFELEITLDGLSGFVVGQIFTIDQSILPRDYYNKNLGFVITGISHMLQNNDWTTTLKTQICLLENENYPSNVDKAKLKQAIEALRQQSQARSYIFYAMADYVIYLMVRIMADKGALEYKTPFEAGTKAVIKGEGMDLGYFDPEKIQESLYRLSDDPKVNASNPGTLTGGYGFKGNAQGSGGGGIKNYMKLWWETKKIDTTLSNFPTGSFDEFTTITLPDGSPITSSIVGQFINLFDKYLLDGTNLEEDLTDKKKGFDKDKDFFLYKFFGKDPKAFLEKSNPPFVSKKTITTQRLSTAKEATNLYIEEKEEVDVINLKLVHIYVLNKIDEYIRSVTQWGYLIQGNSATHSSLEVDIKGEGLYKLDTD